MDFLEISLWSRKVKLYERTQELINQQPMERQTSFFEGMALLMSKPYLETSAADSDKYGYVTQRAA